MMMFPRNIFKFSLRLHRIFFYRSPSLNLGQGWLAPSLFRRSYLRSYLKKKLVFVKVLTSNPFCGSTYITPSDICCAKLANMHLHINAFLIAKSRYCPLTGSKLHQLYLRIISPKSSEEDHCAHIIRRPPKHVAPLLRCQTPSDFIKFDPWHRYDRPV